MQVDCLHRMKNAELYILSLKNELKVIYFIITQRKYSHSLILQSRYILSQPNIKKGENEVMDVMFGLVHCQNVCCGEIERWIGSQVL